MSGQLELSCFSLRARPTDFAAAAALEHALRPTAAVHVHLDYVHLDQVHGQVRILASIEHCTDYALRRPLHGHARRADFAAAAAAAAGRA